ncbi:unnamed protein product, partial [Porites evermanni]
LGPLSNGWEIIIDTLVMMGPFEVSIVCNDLNVLYCQVVTRSGLRIPAGVGVAGSRPIPHQILSASDITGSTILSRLAMQDAWVLGHTCKMWPKDSGLPQQSHLMSCWGRPLADLKAEFKAGPNSRSHSLMAPFQLTQVAQERSWKPYASGCNQDRLMGYRVEGLLHVHKGNVERAEDILMVFDNRLCKPYRVSYSVTGPEILLAETERKVHLHPLSQDPMGTSHHATGYRNGTKLIRSTCS